jgi:hypothetical protein
MAARQHTAVADEPAWLWESLRYQFWRPEDFVHGFMHADRLRPEQREALAAWWSWLEVAEGLGPRMYGAAFVRATERHESEQVRWSLMAMLRDELQHERLFGLAIEQLAAGDAEDGDIAAEEAERWWHEYRRAIDRHGIGVASGALLLRELVIGKVYEQWACGCALPAFATAFHHAAHDSGRHQAFLRALLARDWPRLSVQQRAETAAQVQAAAGFLRAVMLDQVGVEGDRPGRPTAVTPSAATAAGVPTADQRVEMLREALLEIKRLHARYLIPFPDMPELAILGTPPGMAGQWPDGNAARPFENRRRAPSLGQRSSMVWRAR